MNHKDRADRARRGQSLLEAMVALGMLTVGFLGIVALLSQSFYLNRVTQDETTATYLSAEGIEIAKNIIDHDMYRGGGGHWGECFRQALGSAEEQNFAMDYTTLEGGQACGTPAQYPPLGYPPLYDSSQHLIYDTAQNRYGYNFLGAAPSSLVTTDFVREISVTMPNTENGNLIIVSSTVTWSSSPLGSQGVTMVDYFYNWFPY